jgi:sodium/hydrogen antiporter
MNEHLQIVMVCAGIVAWALISRRMATTPLTLPMLFVGFGYALGASGFDLLDARINSSLLHGFAEITLVLVLFTDAAGVHLRSLKHRAAIPARMLLIGMPLTIALGTVVAHWVSPDAPLILAVLVAALLTPTDAALTQSVLSSDKMPSRIRQAINVESGLNDGLAVPVIILAAILSAQVTGTSFEGAPDNLYRFVALQLTLGPLIGIAVGYLLARLLDLAIARGDVTDSARGIAVLAGALSCFALSEWLGGNGFIAAFVGGLTLGNTLKADRTFIFEFMESEGQILTLLTFIIFGAVLLPAGLEHVNWHTWVLALSFLTFVRMLPIWASLAGTGLATSEKLALGWFGPRGLASILFVLLIDEQFNLPGFDAILAGVVLTVLLSIVFHGASAAPIANWFGRRPRPPSSGSSRP